MKVFDHFELSRRALFAALAAFPIAVACSSFTAHAQDDPLPSWNDTSAKQAILDFVGATSHGRQSDLRAAGRADRHLRSGRNAMGRTPDVQPGHLLSGPGSRAGRREARTQGRRALQDRADRRPRGDRQAADARTRKAPFRHAVRHDRRPVSSRSQKVDRIGKGPALEAPLYGADLPADEGGSRLPARQRLQDLHRDRWRPGFCSGLLGGHLRHPAGAGRRNGRKPPPTATARTETRS